MGGGGAESAPPGYDVSPIFPAYEISWTFGNENNANDHIQQFIQYEEQKFFQPVSKGTIDWGSLG